MEDVVVDVVVDALAINKLVADIWTVLLVLQLPDTVAGGMGEFDSMISSTVRPKWNWIYSKTATVQKMYHLSFSLFVKKSIFTLKFRDFRTLNGLLSSLTKYDKRNDSYSKR